MDLNNQMVEIAWTRYSPKQAEEKKKNHACVCSTILSTGGKLTKLTTDTVGTR